MTTQSEGAALREALKLCREQLHALGVGLKARPDSEIAKVIAQADAALSALPAQPAPLPYEVAKKVGAAIVSLRSAQTRLAGHWPLTAADPVAHALEALQAIYALPAQPDQRADARDAARWLPIETAPKDGRLFLCWVSAVRYGETDDGQRYEQEASQVAFCSWRDGPPDLPGHGYFDPCCGQVGDSQDVTHWMPLPEPPAAMGATPPAQPLAAPTFNREAPCSPHLTQCPRCNNPHHACDAYAAGMEDAAPAPAAQPVAKINNGSLMWHLPGPTYSLPRAFLTGVHMLYAAAPSQQERQGLTDGTTEQEDGK